ncbi:unnamed protein product, partial [Ectocarpus sp. 12 AP-2014]
LDRWNDGGSCVTWSRRGYKSSDQRGRRLPRTCPLLKLVVVEVELAEPAAAAAAGLERRRCRLTEGARTRSRQF